MKVAEDKNIEEMVKKLSNYCKANGYPLVLAIGGNDAKEDGVMAFYGSELKLFNLIANFVSNIDETKMKGFFKFVANCLYETLQQFENYDEEKFFGDKAEVKKYVN